MEENVAEPATRRGSGSTPPLMPAREPTLCGSARLSELFQGHVVIKICKEAASLDKVIAMLPHVHHSTTRV